MSYTNTRETDRERYLRNENERLEGELREQGDRRAKEYERREKERAEERRARHPSNRLYNGEIRDPEEAIKAFIWCMEDEARKGWGDDEQAQKFTAEWQHDTETAKAALATYRERIAVARQAFADAERAIFEDFSKHAELSFRSIGDAGMAGDWSRLAI